MANLSTRELFAKLREHFKSNEMVDQDGVRALEQAITETLHDLVDGASPEPPKRKYTRKPKPNGEQKKDDQSLKLPA